MIVGWLFVATIIIGDVSGIGTVLARGEQSALAIAMLLTAVGTLFGVAVFATSISLPDPANGHAYRNDGRDSAGQTRKAG